MRRRDLKLLLGLCLVASAVAAAVALAAGGPQQAHAPRLRGDLLPRQFRDRPAPAFRLHDASTGRVLDSRSLRGRPVAITFLYTRCPDSCPLIAAELQDALGKLGAASRQVAVVAISVDPAHDTPAAVRRWLKRRRAPAQFHYVIGDRRTLVPVWSAWFAEPQDPRYPYSTHSASIWLLDAHSRIRARYSAGAPVPSADIAHDLRVLLAERTRRTRA